MSAMAENIDGIGDPDIEEIRLLRFSVFDSNGQELRFGLNIHKIKEVIEWEYLSPLSGSLMPFVGIYDFRGIPVPVIDVSAKLTGKGVARDERVRPRILVCEVMNRYVGLLVQKTSQISLHLSKDVLPAPDELISTGGVFVNGLVKEQDGQFLNLLDVEAMLGNSGTTEDGWLERPSRTFEGKRILFVEDSKIFQKRAAAFFRELKCDFDIAHNGEEGLRLLQKSANRPYDLVFTDIEMPVMNGIEMAAAIRADERFRSIPIIFISSISNPRLMEEIKSRGLGDFLVKFDPRELLASIERTLN